MKKVSILFDGVHLSYSPTAIGLYDLLSEHFRVRILSQSPKFFDNKPLPNRNVEYIKELTGKNQYRWTNQTMRLRALFCSPEKALKKNKIKVDTVNEFNWVKKHLAREAPDHIVCVDFKNLWFTQLLGKTVEFLSLEIVPDDFFRADCDFRNINSVIIQSRERYDYLFGEKQFKTFYIQNAPNFKALSAAEKPRAELVYCGTVSDGFGFYHCLEFLDKFPRRALHVKGAMLEKERVKRDYQALLASRRLVLDEEYLDDSQVVEYLRQFKIGFCFYNFEVPKINNFNYYSAPSGKMFKYLAAGVPVVGSDVSGLNPIKEFDCGVLIKDLNAESIEKAVETIERNFDYYSENCLKAAAHYSFDKRAQPFVDYLLSSK